jgi:molybdopterin converting factor small subunit
VLKKLKLDKATLKDSIVGSTKIYIDKELKGWLFGIGKVKVKDKDKDLVRTKIGEIIDDFTKHFLSKRKELLEEQRDAFMKAVKDTILQNGNVSESAKKFFLDIPAPMVSKPEKVTDLGEIYDSHRRTEKVLVFNTEYLDKDGFIRDVEERLLKITGGMEEDYCKDYRNSLEILLMQIKTQFEANLATYSLYMKAMIENKDAMMRLGTRVSDAAMALTVCQNGLNKIIWKEIKNA